MSTDQASRDRRSNRLLLGIVILMVVAIVAIWYNDRPRMMVIQTYPNGAVRVIDKGAPLDHTEKFSIEIVAGRGSHSQRGIVVGVWLDGHRLGTVQPEYLGESYRLKEAIGKTTMTVGYRYLGESPEEGHREITRKIVVE